jgi:GTP-binding protein Era
MKTEQEHKSGFVAVVGRTNVGKSTLINSLIGEKIAIVADRTQTTRNKIMCILNTNNAQIMFLDTPGIHKPHHKLGECMMRTAESALAEVDAVLLVVDATERRGAGDNYIIDKLKNYHTPVILVINKIDKLYDKDTIFKVIETYRHGYDFQAVLPMSALTDKDFSPLLKELLKCLPEGPEYFPEDMITDQPERILVGEIIREKILRATRDEVPHSVAVEVEEMKTRPNDSLYIRAEIYVERDSQKGIIIGAGGKMLKLIGQQARKDIEALLGNKAFLELWVKVKPDWRDKEQMLRQLGYKVDK